jgi:hypothetical protein
MPLAQTVSVSRRRPGDGSFTIGCYSIEHSAVPLVKKLVRGDVVGRGEGLCAHKHAHSPKLASGFHFVPDGPSRVTMTYVVQMDPKLSRTRPRARGVDNTHELTRRGMVPAWIVNAMCVRTACAAAAATALTSLGGLAASSGGTDSMISRFGKFCEQYFSEAKVADEFALLMSSRRLALLHPQTADAAAATTAATAAEAEAEVKEEKEAAAE